jgi:hypothetical protein
MPERKEAMLNQCWTGLDNVTVPSDEVPWDEQKG